MAETLCVVCARRAHTTRPISDCCIGFSLKAGQDEQDSGTRSAPLSRLKLIAPLFLGIDVGHLEKSNSRPCTNARIGVVAGGFAAQPN